MFWSTIKFFVFGLVSLAMLNENFFNCNAAPSPRDENMYRELLKLDQLYSSIARPSLRSIPMPPEVGQKVQRALNMLRLQQLDNLYAPRSRPRFGKRGEHAVAPAQFANNNNNNNNMFPFDYDNQMQFQGSEQRNEDETPIEWLPLR